MKEIDYINIIQNVLSSNHIGDDCAYLEDLGIVITQDSLVEDIHFKRNFSTPFELGYKSIAVNLSDIYASGAEAKYLTVALSLPKSVDENFVKEFYEGAKSILNGAKIVGGDITGSNDKIFVSVCAIGSTKGRKISSRKNAKVGYKIITNGTHGSSNAGLNLLLNNNRNSYPEIVKEHLMPSISDKLSKAIATSAKNNYAMMDSSDGLIDALYKIADFSEVSAVVDFKKIPYNKDLEKIENFDYKSAILFGGEDYRLICAISEEDLKKLDENLYTIIGEIQEKSADTVKVKFNGKEIGFNANSLEKNLFNHF